MTGRESVIVMKCLSGVTVSKRIYVSVDAEWQWGGLLLQLSGFLGLV